MSKKKSLGSSPIGYSSLGVDSYEFIPSIDLPSKETHEDIDSSGNGRGTGLHPKDTKSGAPDYESLFTDRPTSGYSDERKSEENDLPPEKKIVSYYLEEELVERLKAVADRKKMYYSTLVSKAIYCWLEQNPLE